MSDVWNLAAQNRQRQVTFSQRGAGPLLNSAVTQLWRERGKNTVPPGVSFTHCLQTLGLKWAKLCQLPKQKAFWTRKKVVFFSFQKADMHKPCPIASLINQQLVNVVVTAVVILSFFMLVFKITYASKGLAHSKTHRHNIKIFGCFYSMTLLVAGCGWHAAYSLCQSWKA